MWWSPEDGDSTFLQNASIYVQGHMTLQPRRRHLQGREKLQLFSQESFYRSRGNSVSIVSDYRQDDWALGVRSPAEPKEFSSSLSVQTSSEADPAS
jgi:hypothetical protein